MTTAITTPSNRQKQALEPQFIITQKMLAGFFERNPSPAQYTVDEIAPAMNAGEREAQRIIKQIRNVKLTIAEREDLHSGLLDFLTEPQNLPACYR